MMTAHYYCNKDFKLRGVAIRECIHNERWSEGDPKCVPGQMCVLFKFISIFFFF